MPAGLASVPDTPPRALVLVRVSKERDGMTSPEIQETAARDYCTARGYVVADVVHGIDQSGSRARSAWWPTLERAVESVEARRYDVVVVWKFSRVARHRVRWAVALDRIETAGGRLESATEQFDTSTSVGQLGRGMLGELNAFYAQQIGEGWKETHARRIASGRPANGKPRWGYAYDTATKTHVPDPETGPVLADLYRRYVAGETFYALVRWLNAHGWRTTVGGSWSEPALRRVMDSGFAAGFFRAGGDDRRKVAPTLREGVHEPLIDRELWQGYLDRRTDRRRAGPRAEASAYLFSGLVTCARCGAAMVANRNDPGTKTDARGRVRSAGPVRVHYRCRKGRDNGPTVCRGGYVAAKVLEAAVVDWLATYAGTVNTEARQVTPIRAVAAVDVMKLKRDLVKLEEAIIRLAVQNAEKPLAPAIYDASRATLEERVARTAAAIAETERRVRKVEGMAGPAAADLLARWDETPTRGRRAILSDLLAGIIVRPGRTGRQIWIVEHDGRVR